LDELFDILKSCEAAVKPGDLIDLPSVGNAENIIIIIIISYLFTLRRATDIPHRKTPMGTRLHLTMMHKNKMKTLRLQPPNFPHTLHF
jgi:hypothetical protein